MEIICLPQSRSGPLSLRPSACLAVTAVCIHSSSKLITRSFHMTSLLCQTSIPQPSVSDMLQNLAQRIGKKRQYNKNGTKVFVWMLTAVVEYTSKEGVSHAEYTIALIYYTFKPYLICPVVLRVVCNLFSSLLNAVPSIPYLYVPSVLQRISGWKYQPAQSILQAGNLNFTELLWEL